MSNGNGNVSRISVSLPEALLQQLDAMVKERGFESRSQAISEMISYFPASTSPGRSAMVLMLLADALAGGGDLGEKASGRKA